MYILLLLLTLYPPPNERLDAHALDRR